MLERAGIVTKAARDDADTDVVETAIEKLPYSDVTIYGDDSDLLVLILHYADKIASSDHVLYYHTKSSWWNVNLFEFCN